MTVNTGYMAVKTSNQIIYYCMTGLLNIPQSPSDFIEFLLSAMITILIFLPLYLFKLTL